MADIAPELYAKIKESFDKKYAQAQLFGGPLSETLAKINNGTATFRDADLYAVEVGSVMADAMKEHLSLEDFPGKTLYQNIAQRTIGEGLKDTYGIVSNVARTIQEEINAENKIGLKAVQPKLETDRVDKIVNRAVNAKSQKTLDNNLTDTVPTFARQVVDDTQKTNARLHNKAGLNVKVEREYDDVGLHNGTDVCDWCLQRAGTWTYDKAMANGVFERHEGCGCIITYTSAKGEIAVSDSKYGGWEIPEEREKRITKEREFLENQQVKNEYTKTKSQIINTLRQTGGKDTGGKHYVAYNPDDKRDVQAAKAYRIISRRNDIEAVAASSGLSIAETKQVKRHIFFEKHQLCEGYRMLDADYDMAVAWNRLANGVPEERDILLMQHELLESQLEKAYNLTIAEAHARAQEKYDWLSKLLEDCGPLGEKDGLL